MHDITNEAQRGTPSADSGVFRSKTWFKKRTFDMGIAVRGRPKCCLTHAR